MKWNLLIILLAVSTSHAGVVGWNNDGTGNFPDATPPVSFDGATGKNVKWKTKLPNWSNSSPIVVDPSFVPPGGTTEGKHAKGPRVVLVAEPVDGYAPLLLCFDADTGKELWRRELDAVPFLPEGAQAEAREVAKRGWAAVRLRKALTAEITALAEKNRDAWKDRNNLPPEAKPILEKAAAAGLQYSGMGVSAGGYANYIHPMGGGQFEKDHRKLKELGLMWSDWDYQGTWDGVAYPTPISDGRRIWTVTTHNLYSCHDMEGTVVWQVRFPPPQRSDLTPDQVTRLTGTNGRIAWPFGWPGAGNFSTSPLMVDGKLVSAAGAILRCLDPETGRVLWADPMDGSNGQNMSVPGIATLGSERYIVSPGGEGRVAEGDGIYRLRDGKRVGLLPGIASSKGSNSGPVVYGDIVVNLPQHNEGKKLNGHRLRVQGDSVTPELVWSLAPKVQQGVNLFRPCWRDGKLYSANGTILDLTTGTVALLGRPRHGGGYAGDGGLLIGNSFMTWDFYKGTFLWSDIQTGAILGEGALPFNPEDGHPLAFKREQACLNHWRWLSASTPFPYKDRLFIRSYDFLWCIAPAFNAGEAAKRVAAADAANRMLMAKEDPSIELRVAAIKALGAAADQEGGKVLRETISAVSTNGAWQHRLHGNVQRLEIGLVMRGLGTAAEPVAVGILKDGDAKSRETVAAGIIYGDIGRSDALRDALIALFAGRAIDVDLLARVLVLWPADAAVTAAFTEALYNDRYGYAQRTMFPYLLPLQQGGKRLAFLKSVVGTNTMQNARTDAIAVMVADGAVAEVRPLMAAVKGRIPMEIASGLRMACADHKDPSVRAAAVDIIYKHLNQEDKYCQMNMVNVLGQFGADAAPALPAIKAINAGEDKKLKDACDQAVATIEKAVKENKEGKN